MKRIHVTECAKRHSGLQVPNDTLPKNGFGSLSPSMAKDFRSALIWHLDNHPENIAELARGSGVSRDIINKLRLRDNSSTTVENAMLIAAFYGKNVNEFIACETSTVRSRAHALVDLLLPEELPLFELQMRGVVQNRDSQ